MSVNNFDHARQQDREVRIPDVLDSHWVRARTVVDHRTGEILRLCECDHRIRVRNAGLEWIADGYRVLPLFGIVLGSDGQWACECAGADGRCHADRDGKHPRSPRDSSGRGGAWAATSDPDQWLNWCDHWPNLNIGLATGFTGQGKGLLVVDVDGADGCTSLKDREVPPTRRHVTGRHGGAHLLYSVSQPIGCGEQGLTSVNMRGNGGYVVAPPSRHLTGRTYCVDEAVPLAEAPAWMVETCGPPAAWAASSHRRDLPKGIRKLLRDEHDSEMNREVRRKDRGTYRDRSQDLFSILLSGVNKNWSDVDLYHLVSEESTLYVLLDEKHQGHEWLQAEIRRARALVQDKPAVATKALSHMDLAFLPEANLDSTTIKVLAAYQRRSLQQNGGKFTFAISQLALAARVSTGTAHKKTQSLITEEWLDRGVVPPKGSRRATQYSLRVPKRLRTIYNEIEAANSGGTMDEPNPPHHTLLDGLRSPTVPPSPLQTFFDSDASYRGKDLLGTSFPVLRVLEAARMQGEGFIPVKEVARRLGQDPSYVRRHLEKMVFLVERDEKRSARLKSNWVQALPAVALAGGGNLRATADRDRAARVHDERQADQLAFALAAGTPLRSQAAENPVTAFVDDRTGDVAVVLLKPLPDTSLPADRVLVGPIIITGHTPRGCLHLAHDDDGERRALTLVRASP